jgi:hypothetical protein
MKPLFYISFDKLLVVRISTLLAAKSVLEGQNLALFRRRLVVGISGPHQALNGFKAWWGPEIPKSKKTVGANIALPKRGLNAMNLQASYFFWSSGNTSIYACKNRI